MHRSFPRDRWPDVLDPAGLGAAQVQAQRARFGPNAILPTDARPAWEALRDTARDPMLWFLVAVGALYALLGQRGEALVLICAALPLVGMDLYLFVRTQASLAGLAGQLATKAWVRRAGVREEIPILDLVPGDLVEIGASGPVPADGLLVDAQELQCDEAILTGESLPIHKHALVNPPSGPNPSVAPEHWLAAGTRVLAGRGLLRVVFTGAETTYGAIVRSVAESRQGLTPLQGAIARLVRQLTLAAGVACLVLAIARLLQGEGLLEALLSAATLAVAAIPEEFPVVLTFFLGVGVYRLARRHALVRRALAVELVGRVTCICTDKTGTLTEGNLRLTHLLPIESRTEPELLRLARAASRAESGDPLDRALLSHPGEPAPAARRATFPFTEDRRRETALFEDHGQLIAALKGSPEEVLTHCVMEPSARAHWLERATTLAQEGHRVLGVARLALPWTEPSAVEPTQGFEFIGLIAFEDPIRPEVPAAIAWCNAEGLRTIMVTGDHPGTALAIAREIGLGGASPKLVTGEELSARLVSGAPIDCDIVARALPAQKHQLVQALQARGALVAVTGDGINDVPALQAADIGIAMGLRGTQSAREAAAIVLLDDNFRSITWAIAEGRQLFENLRLSFLYLLLIHVPLVSSAALIPLLGYPSLFLPVHIVWLELLIHPSAMIAFQRPTRARTAARPAAELLRGSDWRYIALGGGGLACYLGGIYLLAARSSDGVPHGRALVMATLCCGSALVTLLLSGPRRAALGVSALTLVPSLALIQVPSLASALGLAPLHLADWGLVGIGLLVGVVAPWIVWRRDTPRPSGAAHRASHSASAAGAS